MPQSQSGGPPPPPAVGPPSSQDPLVGRLIAERYRVGPLLARGGMGRIYIAMQEPLGRQVALKVLGGVGGVVDDGDDFRERFLREAATLARLRHPNTVTLFDYGVLPEEQLAYMVMELVSGGNLSQVLRQEGRMAPARALWVAHEIARALGEAHGMGIVHRDLKPSNVMLTSGPEGELVKVLDFGIAKLMEEDAHALTGAEHIVGSPGYMAPEQISHQPVDGRTDIYALGALLYVMITGQVPFPGRNPVETYLGHLHKAPPTLAAGLGAPVPAGLEAVVAACLEKDPARRPPDVADLRARLRQAMAEVDPAAAASLAAVPGPSTRGGERAPSGIHRALSTPPAPEDPAASGASTPTLRLAAPAARSRALVLGAALGLLGLVALVVAIGLGLRTMLPAPPAPAPDPPAIAGPLHSLEAPPAVVTVELRSTPPGAEVREGDRVLGQTPLPLELPSQAPRTLVLHLDGHLETEVILSPDDPGGVREVAMQARPSPKRGPASGPSTGSARPDLDIRETR